MKEFSRKVFSGFAGKIGIMSFVLLFLGFAFASQASAAIVISEVYGAGGNGAGTVSSPFATYNQDFVELYNNGATSVDISGYSLQYAPAALSTTAGVYAVCTIAATDTAIEPGTFFLVAFGTSSTTVGSALPTPNATCSAINLGSTSGKVALVSNSTQLSNTSCPTLAAPIVDYVGYGTQGGAGATSCFEGSSAAPTPSNILSVQRNAAGADTNQNGTDFTTATPTPTAGGNGDLTITQSAPASVSTGSNFDYTLTVNNSGSNTNLTGVSVNFTVPTGVTFVSASGGSCTTNNVVAGVVQFRGCTIGANTTNLTVTITAPATAQTITSTGTNVVVDPLATIPETNEGNNMAASVSTTVTAAAPVAPAITSANSTNFTVGQAGTFTVTTTGSPVPALTFTGTLPNGVTFTDNVNGTATIAGTPAMGTAGAYPITITAANGTMPDATQNFTINVGNVVSAASVNLGGLVLSEDGTGIGRALLTLTGGNLQNPQYAQSDANGNYNFPDIQAGATYVLTVRAKGYGFSQANLVVNLDDDYNHANFTGTPKRRVRVLP